MVAVSVQSLIYEGAALVIGGGATVAGFWSFGYFDAKKEKLKDASAAIETLAKALQSLEVASATAYGNLKDLLRTHEIAQIEKFTEIKTQIAVLGTNLEKYRQDITKVEGKLEQNTEMASAHISTLGHVTRQLEALFRIVDAPPRPSDTGTNGSKNR